MIRIDGGIAASPNSVHNRAFLIHQFGQEFAADQMCADFPEY